MVRTSLHRSRILPAYLSALFAALLLLTSAHCAAATIDETIPDAQALTQMEHRAEQAAPRERCYLYAELAHIHAELAGQQFLNGQPDDAIASLQRVEYYAGLVHAALSADTKRIKDAEKLMSHTTHRLSDYLHRASTEDRPALMATFVHLDHVHDELLNQVFAR